VWQQWEFVHPCSVVIGLCVCSLSNWRFFDIENLSLYAVQTYRVAIIYSSHYKYKIQSPTHIMKQFSVFIRTAQAVKWKLNSASGSGATEQHRNSKWRRRNWKLWVCYGTRGWNTWLKGLRRCLWNIWGQAPGGQSIKRWFGRFKETVCCVKRGARRRSVDAVTVDRVREKFHRGPGKFIRRATREIHVPRTSVQKIFHRRLKLRA